MVVGAVPNEEKMTKRAGKLVEEFKELVFPVGYTPGVKRKVGLCHHPSGLPVYSAQCPLLLNQW